MAANVVASRPPERRPTATPTARANIYKLAKDQESDLVIIVAPGSEEIAWNISGVVIR